MAVKDGIGMTEELAVEVVSFTKHCLVLDFERFLSEDEWREVIEAIDAHVPHVKKKIAEAR